MEDSAPPAGADTPFKSDARSQRGVTSAFGCSSGDLNAAGLMDWSLSVDPTVARAHQHARNTTRLTGGWIELHESGARAA